jgi:HlyD family secretion protein
MWRFLKNRRVLFALGLLVVIIVAALWPESIDVDIARVERGPLRVTVDEEGETRVRERFVMSSPVAGRLERIELEPGDAVHHGQVLARLTPVAPALLDARTRAELQAAADAARAALGQARAERARAAAALQRAETSLKREEVLAKAGAVSIDQLEASRTSLRNAMEMDRASVFAAARAEHNLEMARARLQPSSPGGRAIEIHAPVDGVVLKRHHESEAVIPSGEPLLEIGDPTRLEVVSDLLSTDAVRVSAGDPVEMVQWGGGQPLAGRVRRVEPSGFMKVSALGVEEQRVNVIIDFADPSTASRLLGDGYRVEVQIVIWAGTDVVQVPVGSLFRRGTDWAVFVVNNRHANIRTITIDHRNGTAAQVTKGLDAGSTVVLHPPDTLTDGARVKTREGV